MNYESLGELPIIHSLFGGLESPQQMHRCFRVYLTSLDETYNCNFEVLEQEKICGDIRKTPHGPWMKEFRKGGINLTALDYRSSCAVDSEIQLLIGADVAGKLLNGKTQNLGPIAVGTHLGWTITGKIPHPFPVSESCLLIISLLTSDISLPDMRSLERIGIADPVESQTKIELYQAAYEHFQSNLKFNNEGRYEVKLPWLQLHPALSEGRELAERRLRTTINRLKAAHILEAYLDVLLAGLKEGIIEEVNMDNEVLPGHFLPHRAVIKNSSTTKIRPVFDASARTKNSTTLNDCLCKGPDFLELIPTVLTRFRMKKFAATGYIKQAFIQISVSKEDRNYLRFLWIIDGDLNKLKIYRHCRVVFGLTCSPFLLSAILKHHLAKAPPQLKDTALLLQDTFYVDNCLSRGPG
ncbi:uncharacterized protein [Parasteatoda tepidariorum]|uniref:uncharacterized protein n=1 Tax=Parasteatoda tepidariorum TaxID=114398 RepID=UPI00077FA710|nr:uncharacterized protein LOC107454079 [Parasteatoda tepidariorum]